MAENDDALPQGAHRIFRTLHTGPQLWGLPVITAGILMGSAALGFFACRGLFNTLVAVGWIGIHALAWMGMGWLTSQDPTVIPMVMLRFRSTFHPRLTSYRPTRRRVVLKGD